MAQEDLRQDRVKKRRFHRDSKKFEGLKFLATSTKGITEEDAALVNQMKGEIRAKYRS